MSRRDDDEQSLGAANETPVDLAAVQADDALLDMLGGSSAGRSEADAELARVLVAWRRDVDTEPICDLVDTETALAAISAARKPASRRHPVLGPVAAAAAVLVIAFSGVGLVAKSAQPQDQLWGLTKVLYADYARSVETAQQVRTELQQINKDIDEGRTTPAEAQQTLQKLQNIETQLAVVDEAQGRTQLATERKMLEEKLAVIPPSPATTEPGSPGEPAPGPTSAARPVPPAPPVKPAPPDSSSTVSAKPSVPPPPPVDPSTTPTAGSAGPAGPGGEPAPGTTDPSPRSSPPVDSTGSAPPATTPSS